MIEIVDKRNCTGCGACVNACPHKIIRLYEDTEGFLYPCVEKEKCIDCHLCERSCPMLKEGSSSDKRGIGFPQFYAGQLKCKDELMMVSSGGAFWAFAKIIIESKGVVYGAVQDNVDRIAHVRSETYEGIRHMRRSKYFQSNTGQTFSLVKEDLKNGRLVLYSGTGCQIAGLNSFLGKSYDNLYTCDVVCHGVPSHKVWKKYREEKEKLEGKVMSDIVFRDKSLGWSKNQYKITYRDGSEEKELSVRQLFHAGYLQGLFYRPSCGYCKFASLPRVSDISLADYWKYKGRFHKSDSDLGVSLITINTVKGNSLLQQASVYLDYEETEKELALSSCKHLDEHPTENPNREIFFKLFFEEGYFAAARKFVVKAESKSVFSWMKDKLKSVFTYFKS